jgi:hypothetical protein
MISDPLRSAIRYRKLDVNSRDGLTQRSSVVSSGASVVNTIRQPRVLDVGCGTGALTEPAPRTPRPPLRLSDLEAGVAEMLRVARPELRSPPRCGTSTAV